MNSKSLIATMLLCSGAFMACDDDVSPIGGTLASGEVTIMSDSLVMEIESETVYYDKFDGRNSTKLLGRINVPEYGRLSCSFVSQMMSATTLNVPDSITVDDVDSMRLVLSVPRGELTGDSLTPQQLKVFRLEKQLPADITSTFDPAGYYDSGSLMGAKTYTLSNIAKGDSAMKKEAYVRIPVDMPLSFARDIFSRYRAGDTIFEWPSTFNQFFPGIYVEQNFGNGCIANIAKAEMLTYWHYYGKESQMQPDSTYATVSVLKRDSVCLMASQPEVLSSNVIDYQVSDFIKEKVNSGGKIITTPGGYMVNIKFPVKRILEEYNRHENGISIVSSLRLEIPATVIKNDYNIGVAPNMLMIKKSEYEKFFSENRTPDSKTSFYADYDSDNSCYRFNSMRSWFLDVLEEVKKTGTVNEEEYEFVLVPVNVKTESVTDYYGSATVYVTRCQPYLVRPTMTELHTDRSVIVFTYSNQQID